MENISKTNLVAPKVLRQLIGQEVNVFGPHSCEEHEHCLGGGYLVGVEDGFLLLAERANETPDLMIALREIVVIAVVKDHRPELTAVEGGKVYRFRRSESQNELAEAKLEPPSPSKDPK